MGRLILERRQGQEIVVTMPAGGVLRIQLAKVRETGRKAVLALEAEREVEIVRAELLEEERQAHIPVNVDHNARRSGALRPARRR